MTACFESPVLTMSLTSLEARSPNIKMVETGMVHRDQLFYFLCFNDEEVEAQSSEGGNEMISWLVVKSGLHTSRLLLPHWCVILGIF